MGALSHWALVVTPRICWQRRHITKASRPSTKGITCMGCGSAAFPPTASAFGSSCIHPLLPLSPRLWCAASTALLHVPRGELHLRHPSRPHAALATPACSSSQRIGCPAACSPLEVWEAWVSDFNLPADTFWSLFSSGSTIRPTCLLCCKSGYDMVRSHRSEAHVTQGFQRSVVGPCAQGTGTKRDQQAKCQELSSFWF